MRIPDSGAVSLRSIYEEFGVAIPNKTSELYRIHPNVPISGRFNLSDFYGLDNAHTYIATSSIVHTCNYVAATDKDPRSETHTFVSEADPIVYGDGWLIPARDDAVLIRPTIGDFAKTNGNVLDFTFTTPTINNLHPIVTKSGVVTAELFRNFLKLRTVEINGVPLTNLTVDADIQLVDGKFTMLRVMIFGQLALDVLNVNGGTFTMKVTAGRPLFNFNSTV